jgi:hypothetical protein
MATLAYPIDVRNLGRLPERIADAEIRPHLESAGRMLFGWIGDYSQAAGDNRDAAKEAECSIAMALMIPVLHTFFTEGAPKYTKEIGEVEFMFHNPSQSEQVARRWMDRARDAIRRYRANAAETDMDFFAI